MTIFLAEDNPADVYLLKESLAAWGCLNLNIVVAQDGEEALGLVRDHFPDGERPDLIVLDLNLPKSDGTEILRTIREMEYLADVPVVILTSSDSPRDRAAAERLGASCYITKPSDLDAFMALGGQLMSYVLPQSRSATSQC